MTDTSRAVVITGASTGIGEASVEALANAGFHVFAGVRKQADADRLRQQFGDKVTPLTMEVTDAASLSAAAGAVRERLGGHTLKGLFCNAGIAVSGPLMHIPVEKFEHQIDVNLTGVLRTVQAFAPLLGADESLSGAPGRIAVTSSVAGKSGAPFLGPYAASKHGLEGMSESLRRELMMYGVDVAIIAPGAIKTPIWDKAETEDVAQYAQTDFVGPLTRIQSYMLKMGAAGLPASKVAEKVVHAMTAAKPKLRYAIVPNPLEYFMQVHVLPRRMVDKIVAKRLGLTQS